MYNYEYLLYFGYNSDVDFPGWNQSEPVRESSESPHRQQFLPLNFHTAFGCHTIAPSLMGRKPNQLILEFFERGQKLQDASNRYEHTCKSCGEKVAKHHA